MIEFVQKKKTKTEKRKQTFEETEEIARFISDHALQQEVQALAVSVGTKTVHGMWEYGGGRARRPAYTCCRQPQVLRPQVAAYSSTI